MRSFIFYLGVVLICCSCNRKTETQNETAIADSIQEPYGCCAPEVLDKSWYTSGKKAPLLSGLKGIQFPISSKNQEAKDYFEQGIMLSFGFNHAEAARSFFEAARQDSSCAICWWGYAYVLGPNYNAGMEPDNFQRAYEAVSKAKERMGNSSAKEKDLITALTFRYSNDTTIARPVLDSSYAVAMRKVYKKYPDDVTVASLFAESLMDLHPWNLWNKDGTMQPWTPEIIAVLEECLRKEPRHAGANHLYIHAIEMSQEAEKSVPSADLLRDLVPGSGHLVHMPSHTYIRIGRYHDGVIANQKAVLVDSLYMVACHAQGVYPLAYYPHNHHFISACATLSGERKIAMEGAMATSLHAHKKLFREPGWATLQHYYSIPWFVQVKFGLWDDIIQSTPPEKDLKYPMVIWHYANGMAMLGKNNVAKARAHLVEINTIMEDTTIKELTIWGINNVYDICKIAARVLEGEILGKERNYPLAIARLKEAVEFEDALNYDEPPDWFFSVRHHLGAVLTESGNYPEAVKIYKEDLKTYRENGWALKGLMDAYNLMKDKENYNKTKARFDEAWKYSDTMIASSRILY